MFPPLPSSWSALTWQQLVHTWTLKMQFTNADVARVKAFFYLCNLTPCAARSVAGVANDDTPTLPTTGERLFTLTDKDGQRYEATAREIAHLAAETLPWLDFPYGDPGEKEKTDEDGNVIRKRREAVQGFVSPMLDAMILPVGEVRLKHGRLIGRADQGEWQAADTGIRPNRWRRIVSALSPTSWFPPTFQMPQVACNNLTWQQYRTLQVIIPQLFSEESNEQAVIELQAQFLAHILTPRSRALFDTTGGSIKLRPHWEYRYSPERAEEMTVWWKRRLPFSQQLFHVCFQTFQTALSYYSVRYPLLFGDSKADTMKDALTGEVGTINTIMKYAGYAAQQEVYDSNLPFVLDILNTIAKEAKEIEKMNRKIKK